MKNPGMQCQPDPILMSDPRSVVLEHWTTDLRRDALYLVGHVHGATGIRNGTLYRTSPVKWIRADLGIAETQTGVYILRNRR